MNVEEYEPGTGCVRLVAVVGMCYNKRRLSSLRYKDCDTILVEMVYVVACYMERKVIL